MATRGKYSKRKYTTRKRTVKSRTYKKRGGFTYNDKRGKGKGKGKKGSVDKSRQSKSARRNAN